MTQEDKDLLIKDLCARLPYDVELNIIIEDSFFANFNDSLKSIDKIFGIVNDKHSIEEVKPYLFPLSSMTDEQITEIWTNYHILLDAEGDIIPNPNEFVTVNDINTYLDWLYSHHFDVHGLIDKGLAIDATNLNIY